MVKSMAILKRPSKIQTGYNELTFIDTERTALMVQSISPSGVESVTFRRVRQLVDNPYVAGNKVKAAVFNTRSYVSKLFEDLKIPVTVQNPAGFPAWCFEDLNLRVIYSVDEMQYTALNGVRQIGESPDMYKNALPILSNTAVENGRRTVPAYEGYPVGVSVMVTEPYEELDMSDALILEITIPENNTVFGFRLTGSGALYWDALKPDAVPYNTTSSTSFTHIFDAGTHRIAVKSSDTATMNFNTGYGVYLDRVLQWGRNIREMQFNECDNLYELPKDPIPAGLTSITSMFYACTSLRNVPANIFSETAATIEYAANAFNYCGLEDIPAGMFDGFVNCLVFNNAFGGSSVVSVPDELFKDAVKCTSFANVFNNCLNLRKIGRNIFSGAGAATTFASAFNQCEALEDLDPATFQGAVAATIFNGTFYNCIALKSIPVNLFDNNLLARNFVNCFTRCLSLTGSTPSTNGLKLWQRAGAPGFPDSVTGTACFLSSPGLSDYDSIPSNWK